MEPTPKSEPEVREPTASATLRPVNHLRTTLLYALVIGASVVLYLWIRGRGEALGDAPAPAVVARESSHNSSFGHLLLALAAVTLCARFVGGALRRWLGQPPVIGEILTGLMLGPSLLGAVWPEGQALILPPDVAPYLKALAQFGVVLFMFLIGLEIDLRTLRASTHATVVISHASIVVPFLLGAGLALWLFPQYATAGVSFTAFSLFIGVSLSITAFPVLARILSDRRVQGTKLGTLALTCAAIDDLTAWSLLALVSGIIHAQVSSAAWTLVWAVVYLAGMLVFARPLLRWLLSKLHVEGEPPSRTALAVVFGSVLLSATATEVIGLHALFGAFLVGTLVPRESDIRHKVQVRLEDFVVVLLLPAFFAFTGMRTKVGLLDDSAAWMACGVIVVIATIGKFGGSALAARWAGLGWRHASALGLLMNTRGLVQLIVLNLGLELGVISEKVFAMLVIMALVTTFATTPLLDLFIGRSVFDDEPVPPAKAS
jgi:Kef-type K+ transport system membrane component KefB